MVSIIKARSIKFTRLKEGDICTVERGPGMKQNSEYRNRWTGITCSDQYTPKSGISDQQENEISYSINGLRIFWISRAELVEGGL